MSHTKSSTKSTTKPFIKKPVVFITRPIPQSGIDMIKKHATVVLRKTDSWIPRKELIAGARKADILLPILTDPIDAEVMDAAPRVKLIANYGAGYNNIDVDAATERGILVSNTPGVLNDATAELTITLLLAVARRVVETDAIQRAGKYPGWGPMMYMGHQVTGKTLGIVGMGRIGKCVAEVAHAGFGMKILYANEVRESQIEKKLKAKKVPLNTLLTQADFVTLHVPLTKGTQHLISTKELKMMKRDAFLVNTSRGPVVDEKALVKALQGHQIAGAALDVYEREPKMEPGLKRMPNVVTVPHIGSATKETRAAMAELAASNVIAFIQGKNLPTPVNA